MSQDTRFPSLLEKTLSHSLAYLEGLPDAPVGATATLEELRGRFGQALPDEGTDAIGVIDRLVAGVEGGMHASAGGRFFGWVIGGSVPAALAADWLTSAWDQNAGMFAVAPAAAVVEEVAGRWLCELLGLPPDSGMAFVTGCQMAHVTCLAAARNEVLRRHGWDVEQRGLFGAPRIRVVTNDQRHGTIERALRMLGMGRDCLVDIPVDGEGHLTAEALEAALAEDPDSPTIVLLQAGDLHTGAFDPFEEVIPVAHRHDAWVHVDGAFGLWAAASPEYRHLTRGVEQADSWATDGHKWLNVPYDSGYAIVADRDAHYRALTHRAEYLDHSEVARDQVDWNPEYSRRARGFATWAAIASLGSKGIARIVEDCCRHARRIVTEAGQLPGVVVECLPLLNQGLLRFPDQDPDATPEDDDRRTDDVVARIVASGEAFFATTTWRGRRCMRVSVCNWQTGDEDVDRTIRAIEEALA